MLMSKKNRIKRLEVGQVLPDEAGLLLKHYEERINLDANILLQIPANVPAWIVDHLIIAAGCYRSDHYQSIQANPIKSDADLQYLIVGDVATLAQDELDYIDKYSKKVDLMLNSYSDSELMSMLEDASPIRLERL